MYDVIYNSIPIISQYLKSLGVDSPATSYEIRRFETNQITIAGGQKKGTNEKSFVFIRQHGSDDVT